MTQNTKPDLDKPESEHCDRERVFVSPVALAFVRIVVARRGITEPQARQIYLDYINGTQPEREHRPCSAA
jgi:hypothetical protein